MDMELVNLLEYSSFSEDAFKRNSLETADNINDFLRLNDNLLIGSVIPLHNSTDMEMKESIDRIDKILLEKDKDNFTFTLDIAKSVENRINEQMKNNKKIAIKQIEETEEVEIEETEEAVIEETEIEQTEIEQIEETEDINSVGMEESEDLSNVEMEEESEESEEVEEEIIEDSMLIEDNVTQNTETQTLTLSQSQNKNPIQKIQIEKENSSVNLEIHNEKSKEKKHNKLMSTHENEEENEKVEVEKEIVEYVDEEEGDEYKFEINMDDIGKVQKLKKNSSDDDTTDNGFKKSNRKRKEVTFYTSNDFNSDGDYVSKEAKKKYNLNVLSDDDDDSSMEVVIDYNLKKNEVITLDKTKLIDDINTVEFLKKIFIQNIGSIDKKTLLTIDVLTEDKLKDKTLFNIVHRMFIARLNLIKENIGDSKKYKAIDMLEQAEKDYHRLFGQIFCLDIKNEDSDLFKVYHCIYNCSKYELTKKNQTKTNIKFTFIRKKKKTFEKELIINSNLIPVIGSFNYFSHLSFYIHKRTIVRLSNFKDKNQVNFDMRFLIEEYKIIRRSQLLMGVKFFKD